MELEDKKIEIQNWLVATIADFIKIDADFIDVDQNMFDLGLSSKDGFSLASQLGKKYNISDFNPNLLREASCITELSLLLAKRVVEQIDVNTLIKKSDSIDLLKEAELPSDLKIQSNNYIFNENPGSVFITGATGFLGAYLLKDLITHTSAKIYCLVRASSESEGKQRLIDNLNNYFHDLHDLHNRIVAVTGDLSKEKMGIDNYTYELLSDTIDIVYHNGALVNFLESYEKLKLVNIKGTQEILRFASYKKTKPVNMISSFSVLMSETTLKMNHIADDVELEHFNDLPNAYAQSKWVSERLVTNAKQKGFPVNIFRPGFILADQKTGSFKADDYVPLMIKTWTRMNYAATTDGPIDLTPVDYISECIVSISLNKSAQGKIFNLVNPKPVLASKIIDVLIQKGFKIERVPYDEWLEILLKKHNDDTMNELVKSFKKILVDDYLDINPKVSVANTLKYKSPSSVCPSGNELIEQYIDAFTARGYLTKS